MDYGTTKILPLTGGAVLIGGLTGQLLAVGLIIGAVMCAAVLIRVIWRHRRSVGE